MKIRIKSAAESFRRAGIEATREGVIVETDDLSEAQIEALQHERMLSITPVMDEEHGGAGGNGEGDDPGTPPAGEANGAPAGAEAATVADHAQAKPKADQKAKAKAGRA